MSLYRTGACQNLTDVLKGSHIKIAALQEIGWIDTDQLNVNEYTIYYSDIERAYQLGIGFTIHKDLVCYV